MSLPSSQLFLSVDPELSSGYGLLDFLGIIIKYAETYAGLRYRQLCPRGKGYDGGPMYFIPAAFKGRLGKFLACTAATLLCIYGVEIYQFTVVTKNTQRNNRFLTRNHYHYMLSTHTLHRAWRGS
jgi:Na+/alanine symporter